MNLIQKLEQLERVDQLIRLKATGSPYALAQRLEISERTTYNLIDTLRLLGAKIYYCDRKESYCYEREVRFFFGILPPDKDLNSIKGGNAPDINVYQMLQEVFAKKI